MDYTVHIDRFYYNQLNNRPETQPEYTSPSEETRQKLATLLKEQPDIICFSAGVTFDPYLHDTFKGYTFVIPGEWNYNTSRIAFRTDRFVFEKTDFSESAGASSIQCRLRDVRNQALLTIDSNKGIIQPFYHRVRLFSCIATCFSKVGKATLPLWRLLFRR